MRGVRAQWCPLPRHAATHNLAVCGAAAVAAAAAGYGSVAFSLMAVLHRIDWVAARNRARALAVETEGLTAAAAAASDVPSALDSVET